MFNRNEKIREPHRTLWYGQNWSLETCFTKNIIPYPYYWLEFMFFFPSVITFIF